MAGTLELDALLTALKAAAEPTRLRLLALLLDGELNVKDLTQILGQSQPRISRHLKLLAEAGLVERVREGSWAYFHLADGPGAARLAHTLVAAIDGANPLMQRDRSRAEALKRERAEAAQAFFREHAAEWDKIRSLHVAEAEVEAAMLNALGPGPFDLLVDLGTGTGRMLELFADRYRRGLGIDASQAMLGYARTKLDRARLQHAQVRQGDIYHLGLDDSVAGAVVMHQVLHYLSDPARAIREAARVLAPGGRLLLVDFAPHDLEFLRDTFAHVRLGFARPQVEQWLAEAGLEPLEARELQPPVKTQRDKLTVSLWLAARPGSLPARAVPEVLEATS
jgi:ArsR family transcriptional regulator